MVDRSSQKGASLTPAPAKQGVSTGLLATGERTQLAAKFALASLETPMPNIGPTKLESMLLNQ